MTTAYPMTVNPPDPVVDPTDFPVFMTMKLGVGPKNVREFGEAIRRNGTLIDEFGENLLTDPHIEIPSPEREIDLVLVSNECLRLGNAQVAHTYVRAEQHGLLACHDEVALRFCLQFNGRLEPDRATFLVATEKLLGSGGKRGYVGPALFCVRQDAGGQLTLSADIGHGAWVWGNKTHYLFEKPRKTTVTA